MGRRGPPPQPTQLKILRGNPGRRPINKNEPKPTAVSPVRPAWLDPIAKREWNRIVPELERLGLLTMVDGAALEAYCQNYAILVRSQVELKQYLRDHGTLMVKYTNKAGAENMIPHPAIKVAAEAAKIVKAFAAEFGLTPSSRSRFSVQTGKVDPDKDEKAAYEEFRRRIRAKE